MVLHVLVRIERRPREVGKRDIFASRLAGAIRSLCTSRDASNRRRELSTPLRWTPAGGERTNRCEGLEPDAQTDMLPGEPKSAICVQRFDDSLNSAIHTTYRTWLRSSSMHEPRDPPLKVVSQFGTSRSVDQFGKKKHQRWVCRVHSGVYTRMVHTR